jgi:hypothetical protein
MCNSNQLLLRRTLVRTNGYAAKRKRKHFVFAYTALHKMFQIPFKALWGYAFYIISFFILPTSFYIAPHGKEKSK